MDRRSFVIGTAAVAAAGLLGKAAEAAPAKADVHPQLSGVWNDPYLRQPSSIIISSNRSGSDVKVTGTYWHDEYGQSTFHGTGRLQGDELVLDYGHHGSSDLGQGQVTMTLGQIGGVNVLKGRIRKADGAWSADQVIWYQQRH